MELEPPVEFSDAWTVFVNAVEKVWTGEHDTRKERPHLGHYQEPARVAVALVRDARLGLALQEAYLRCLSDPLNAGPARLYVLELRGFADAAGKPANQTSPAPNDLLEDAGTIADSAKDIFSDLPGWVKATIHGFGEVAKLFKRK